jgi:hypothetical protein
MQYRQNVASHVGFSVGGSSPETVHYRTEHNIAAILGWENMMCVGRHSHSSWRVASCHVTSLTMMATTESIAVMATPSRDERSAIHMASMATMDIARLGIIAVE